MTNGIRAIPSLAWRTLIWLIHGITHLLHIDLVNPWYYPSPPYPFHNPNFFHPFQPPEYSPPPTPPYAFHPPQPPPYYAPPLTPPYAYHPPQSPPHYTPLSFHSYNCQPNCSCFMSPLDTAAQFQPGAAFAQQPEIYAHQVFNESPVTLMSMSDTTRNQLLDNCSKMIKTLETMGEICKGICSKPVSQSLPMSTRISAVDNSLKRNDNVGDVSVSILGETVAFKGSGDTTDGDEGFCLFKEAEESVKEAESDGGAENWSTAEGYEPWDGDSEMEEDGVATKKGEVDDVENNDSDDDMCLFGYALKMFDESPEPQLDISAPDMFDESPQKEYVLTGKSEECSKMTSSVEALNSAHMMFDITTERNSKEVNQSTGCENDMVIGQRGNSLKIDVKVCNKQIVEQRSGINFLDSNAVNSILTVGDVASEGLKESVPEEDGIAEEEGEVDDVENNDDDVAKQKREVNGIEDNVSEVITLPIEKNSALVNETRSNVGKSNAFNFDPGGDIVDVSLIEVQIEDAATHLGLLYCGDQLLDTVDLGEMRNEIGVILMSGIGVNDEGVVKMAFEVSPVVGEECEEEESSAFVSSCWVGADNVVVTSSVCMQVEDKGLVKGHSLPNHRAAPATVEQATEQQILVTGIKVVDLLTPYQKMDANLFASCLCVMHIIEMLPATRITNIFADNCMDVSGTNLLVFDSGGSELYGHVSCAINMFNDEILQQEVKLDAVGIRSVWSACEHLRHHDIGSGLSRNSVPQLWILRRNIVETRTWLTSTRIVQHMDSNITVHLLQAAKAIDGIIMTRSGDELRDGFSIMLLEDSNATGFHRTQWKPGSFIGNHSNAVQSHRTKLAIIVDLSVLQNHPSLHPHVAAIKDGDCTEGCSAITDSEALLLADPTTVFTMINHAIGVVGVVNQECKAVVDHYRQEIMVMLLTEAPPEKICSQIGLCTFDGTRGAMCSTCKMTVVWMLNQMRQTQTQDRILNCVNELCDYFKQYILKVGVLLISTWDIKALVALWSFVTKLKHKRNLSQQKEQPKTFILEQIRQGSGEFKLGEYFVQPSQVKVPFVTRMARAWYWCVIVLVFDPGTLVARRCSQFRLILEDKDDFKRGYLSHTKDLLDSIILFSGTQI